MKLKRVYVRLSWFVVRVLGFVERECATFLFRSSSPVIRCVSHARTSPLPEISAVVWASSDGVFLASAGVMHAAVAAGAALLLLAALSAEVSMRFAHAHAHMRARGERDTTHPHNRLWSTCSVWLEGLSSRLVV